MTQTKNLFNSKQKEKQPFYVKQFIVDNMFHGKELNEIENRYKMDLYEEVSKNINPGKSYKLFETNWIAEKGGDGLIRQRDTLITYRKFLFVALISLDPSDHKSPIEVGDYAWAAKRERNSGLVPTDSIIGKVELAQTEKAILEEYCAEGSFYYFWKVTEII